jgi:hypothetical protein
MQLSPRHAAHEQQQLKQGVSWDAANERPSSQGLGLPIFREEEEEEEHQEEEEEEVLSRRSSSGASSSSSASYQLRDDASSTSDESFERWGGCGRIHKLILSVGFLEICSGSAGLKTYLLSFMNARHAYNNVVQKHLLMILNAPYHQCGHA